MLIHSEFDVTYTALGESTLLLEWPPHISKEILSEITRIQTTLKKQPLSGVSETWSTYRSLAISFDPEITTINHLKKQLSELDIDGMKPVNYRWIIPVHYGGEKGRDLAAFAKAKRLSVEQVIFLHTATAYTIYFRGFLPGFMYLGGLNPQLHLPRKSNPDRAVPRGSVAIGGSQTGIYPIKSPGGWHVIGSTPVALFDPQANPPCWANTGDEILFEAVDTSAFRQIEAQVRSGIYKLQKQKIHG